MKQVGLRIDVDTFRGTRDGVPRLLELLGRHGSSKLLLQRRAGQYGAPSVAPDKTEVSVEDAAFQSRLAVRLGYSAGRHRLAGRRIGAGNEAVIRAAAESHEVGLHAWDHYSWQAWSGVWPQERLALEVERGLLELERIIGRPVTCSAVAGWRADQRVVKAKESFDFLYNSDCRGTRPFLPQLGSGVSGTVQIPVTLPTRDEAVGTAVDIAGFNRYLLDCIHRDAGVPVYTIHAEVEGIAYADQFNELLTMAAEEEIQFCPLSQLLPADFSELPSGKVVRGELAGREGWLGREQLLTSGI